MFRGLCLSLPLDDSSLTRFGRIRWLLLSSQNPNPDQVLFTIWYIFQREAGNVDLLLFVCALSLLLDYTGKKL